MGERSKKESERSKKDSGVVIDIEQLKQDEHNFNKGTAAGKKLMEKSFAQFGAGRSILVDKENRIIAGNKSQLAAMGAGIKKVRVIETTGDELIAVKRTDIELDSKEGRELALADNLTTQVNLSWDEAEFARVGEDVAGFEVSDWCVDLKMAEVMGGESDDNEARRLEFEKRIEAGEAVEGDEDYKNFVKKFELRKTTDDCYTPDEVYDAVADYVSEQYGLSRSNFVRPFYPGGDYKNYKYKKGDVVVDNPPFSILAEIKSFYIERNIPFWLFAPTLTLFDSSKNVLKKICYLLIGISIRYKNNAVVNTSFVTNLENGIIIKTAPELYEKIRNAQKEKQKEKPTLPVYRYPMNVLTASSLYPLNKFGVHLQIRASEVYRVGKLDCQNGKAIFGGGFLIGERAEKERERAEKERERAEKEEREKMAIVWELSEREKEIVRSLGGESLPG